MAGHLSVTQLRMPSFSSAQREGALQFGRVVALCPLTSSPSPSSFSLKSELEV